MEHAIDKIVDIFLSNGITGALALILGYYTYKQRDAINALHAVYAQKIEDLTSARFADLKDLSVIVTNNSLAMNTGNIANESRTRTLESLAANAALAAQALTNVESKNVILTSEIADLKTEISRLTLISAQRV